MRQTNMRTEAHDKRETCAPLCGAHTETALGHRNGHGHEAGARPHTKATETVQATAPRDGPRPHGDGHSHGGTATSPPGLRSGRPIPDDDTRLRPQERGLPTNVDKSRLEGPRPRTKASARTDADPAPMLTSPGPDTPAGPMLTMLTRRSA